MKSDFLTASIRHFYVRARSRYVATRLSKPGISRYSTSKMHSAIVLLPYSAVRFLLSPSSQSFSYLSLCSRCPSDVTRLTEHSPPYSSLQSTSRTSNRESAVCPDTRRSILDRAHTVELAMSPACSKLRSGSRPNCDHSDARTAGTPSPICTCGGVGDAASAHGRLLYQLCHRLLLLCRNWSCSISN